MSTEKQCAICGKGFSKFSRYKPCCSSECKNEHLRSSMPPGLTDSELEIVERLNRDEAGPWDEHYIDSRIREITEAMREKWSADRLSGQERHMPVVTKAYENVTQGRGDTYHLNCVGDANWT
ncbi:hypothetical protein [Bremerella sp. P1]|uniref:hypothetical protein n=1 Tax=Bremerella sp. P1 TaxID=3026424 RepID=UPI002368F314|nr:hypothetical protein [Bremerella sp. P1]WDI44759.1 hypothetical protein PSR63_12515 [Bremerella sp. P1]